MDDRSVRASGLDLDHAALERLLGDAAALAHDEISATRTGPVFARFGLRAFVTNFRTTEEDVRRAMAVVQELGS